MQVEEKEEEEEEEERSMSRRSRRWCMKRKMRRKRRSREEGKEVKAGFLFSLSSSSSGVSPLLSQEAGLGARRERVERDDGSSL